jgi:hypothetical protein
MLPSDSDRAIIALVRSKNLERITKMTTTKLTAKEIEMLKAIVDSEYIDGEDPVEHEIWFDYVVDSKSKGGVFTSLQEKGFVKAYITKEKLDRSDRFSPTTSTIRITQAGFDALNG